MKYVSQLSSVVLFLCAPFSLPSPLAAQQNGHTPKSSNTAKGSGNNNDEDHWRGIEDELQHAPLGQTSTTTESNPFGQLIQSGGVDDLHALNDLGFEGAQTIINAANGNLQQLGLLLNDGGGLSNFITRAGSASNLIDVFEKAKGHLPTSADELIGESADLINQIFQDTTITTRHLSEKHLFDSTRLFANEFNAQMIGLAAEFSGNEAIGAAIQSRVSTTSLNSSHDFFNELVSILTSATNFDVLGTRTKDLDLIAGLTARDFEVYAGKDVTIEAGSQISLSPRDF